MVEEGGQNTHVSDVHACTTGTLRPSLTKLHSDRSRIARFEAPLLLARESMVHSAACVPSSCRHGHQIKASLSH